MADFATPAQCCVEALQYVVGGLTAIGPIERKAVTRGVFWVFEHPRNFREKLDTVLSRRKSGPALGGTEYRLMQSACRLIVRAKL